MKKVKTLLVTTSLLLGSFIYAGAQEECEDTHYLQEVEIRCVQHHWDWGWFGFTYHFATIKCNNGFEQTIMI